MNRMHHKGRLDGHGRSITRIHTWKKRTQRGISNLPFPTINDDDLLFYFTGSQTIRHRRYASASITINGRSQKAAFTHFLHDILVKLYKNRGWERRVP
jgi:hypothetical protein